MSVMTDFDEMLNDVYERISSLEQMITSPDVVGSSGNVFDEGIIVGPEGDEIVLDPRTPAAPVFNAGGVTWGAYYDRLFADVTWTRDTSSGWQSTFEVEVAKKLPDNSYAVAQVLSTSGTTMRVEPLEPNTTYAFRITALSRIGRRSAPTAWVEVAIGQDQTLPAAPTGLSVSRGATSLVVRWTASAAPDVATYRVQVATDAAFTAIVRDVFSSSTVVAISDFVTEGTLYVRVSAYDRSNNQGAWVTNAGVVAGGVNDSMIVADLSAAKITFGTMSGDRIAANTLDVNTLKASTLTSKIITIGAGGQFKIGQPGTIGQTGLLINDQGIRLYDTTGGASVALDAITGAGTFTGVVNATGGTFSGTITGGTFSGGAFRTTADTMSMDANGLQIRSASGYNAQRAIRFLNTAGNAELARIYCNSSSVGNIYMEALGSSSIITLKGRSISFYDDGGGLGFSQSNTGIAMYKRVDFNAEPHTGDWWRNDYNTSMIYQQNYAVGFEAGSGLVKTYNNARFVAKSGYIDSYAGHLEAQSDGNSSTSIGHHHPGVRGTKMAYNRDDACVYFQNNSGGWQTCYGGWSNQSRSDTKENVRQLEKGEARKKLKAANPKRYKQKPSKPKVITEEDRWIKVPTEGPAQESVRRAAAIVGHLTGAQVRTDRVPNPNLIDDETDEELDKKFSAKSLAHQRWDRDRDQFGWFAEEMHELFPEVVTYGEDGKPGGIQYGMMTVPLWQICQEQDDEIEALKLRIAALEGAKK